MNPVDDVRSVLSRAGAGATPAGLAAALHDAQARGQRPRSSAELSRAVPVVRAELIGLGPLQPFAEEPGVTDVLVNGDGVVWTDSGVGLRRRDLRLGPEPVVRALAVRLAAVSGRRLDDAHPWVDAQLPGGVRLHAVLPPVSVDGTCISLRVPGRGWSLDDLVEAGAVARSWRPVLTAVMAARVNFLVSGATGTGKSSVLAAMLATCPVTERVVVVEDTVELSVGAGHVVRVQARQANADGAGSVEMADLVRQALRMRPDRVVVGECRGREVIDLLTALNTGHCGCATVHANSAEDVPSRLEALGLLAGVPRQAMQAQICAGLQLLIHLTRDSVRGRRLAGVAVVDPSSAAPNVRTALALSDSDETRVGPGWPALAALIGWIGGPPC